MIKLIIDPQGKSTQVSYNKDLIIIGDGPADSSDICFPAIGLHKCHLKIILRDSEYWIVNQANDPFVTLNQQSFGKKKLAPQDIIALRDHEIKVEEILSNESHLITPIKTEQKIQTPPQVLAQNEPVEIKKAPPISPLKDDEVQIEHQKAPPLQKPSPKQKPSRKKRHKWFRAIVLCSLAACIGFIFILGELYIRATDKMTKEEMLAAESIADYAMALQYAKVYHIAPQKQNWIDPQFLKNNLVDLLSTTALPCGNIDAQGQFCNCPYILRFYTNQDFSRFLLIAQAQATFSQWFLPKKTLIVDSSLMEIRKTDDLKSLNRLLSYPTPLDGANGDEVKKAILQTEILPLEILSKETGKLDFSPPNALSYMKPGAENLIYNAPRYHLFGETFLNKALSLSENRQNAHEMKILQSELDTLAKFHNLIFYSSKGLKQAQKGYRALQQLVLPSNFFTAYLLFSKEGNIINSRLIIDSELPSLTADAYEEKIPEKTNLESLVKIEDDDELTLAQLLRDQAEGTLEEIGPIIHNIFTILEDVVEKDSLFIPPSIIQLLELYQVKQESVHQRLKNSIDSFKKSHPYLNAQTLDRQLREHGLLDFYNLSSQDTKADEPLSHLRLENFRAWQNIVESVVQNKPSHIFWSQRHL